MIKRLGNYQKNTVYMHFNRFLRFCPTTKRGISIIFFRADNYANIAKEILVSKYRTKVKLRAAIGETRSSHCQKITALPR